MRRTSSWGIPAWVPVGAGLLFLLLGGITLGYALPGTTTTHTATVLYERYEAGNRTTASSWNVGLDVDGVGAMETDSKAFYAVAKTLSGTPHVSVDVRGGEVQTIRFDGRAYDTAQASRNTQFVEAAVLLALALGCFGLALRRRRQTSVGAPGASQTTRSPSDEPASTRSATERG